MLKKQLIMPKILLPGDFIGIVAPASPFDIDKFVKGVNLLKSLGFCVRYSEELFQKNGYLAGSDFHRASLLNCLFADKSIKAIFCARGGFGSLRILSLLDYASIKKNPKIFMGYSDVTAILSAITQQASLVTFHGPMVADLYNANKKTIESIGSALSSCQPIEVLSEKGVVIKSGSATGIVSGGNLATLCHLTGTPFEPDLDGGILFIEEIGEAPYRIDRMLTHMKLAGCFDKLAGLALGSFKECGSLDEVYGIVENIFRDTEIPILAGFDTGHGGVNIVLPVGLNATLNTSNLKIRFHESATEC